MSIDIKTTILHYKPLVERKNSMIFQMEKHGFSDYSFFEEFDGNELSQEEIELYCVRKHRDWDNVAKKIAPWNIGVETQKELNIGEVSLSIKHGKVIQQLSEQCGDVFIIFEDDVLLCDDFADRLREYMVKTPKEWDVIYFGSGANLKPQRIVDGEVAYLMDHPASRCSDSIILKKSVVCDMARTWFPFHLTSDFELGYQHYFHDHRVYWWEPGLVRQGSEHGVFKSVLR